MKPILISGCADGAITNWITTIWFAIRGVNGQENSFDTGFLENGSQLSVVTAGTATNATNRKTTFHFRRHMIDDDFCEDDYEGDDIPEDPIDAAIDDCGIGPDGLCMLAGTEFCDFDCPFRDGGHPITDDFSDPEEDLCPI